MRLGVNVFLTSGAANAGYMASRNGSATAAPSPRNIARRDKVMVILELLLISLDQR